MHMAQQQGVLLTGLAYHADILMNYLGLHTQSYGGLCVKIYASSAVLRGGAFQRMHPPMPALAAEDVDADPARPLVVGYMSPDLFTHSVSYFAEAPLALHDPSRRAANGFLCTCSSTCWLTRCHLCLASPRQLDVAGMNCLTCQRRHDAGQF